MRREDRAVVGLLGFLHGAVHANLLAIPVFLNLPWRSEFHADSVVVGLLAATTYACFGFSSVPFGFLADRRPPTRLLMLSAGGIAVSLASLAFSTNLPWLALPLPQFLGGGLFAVALGLGAVGQVVAGTLADRRRPDRILTSLSLTAAVLLALLAAFLGSASFVLGGLAFGFVLFSLEALQNTLVTRTAPHESRGLAFGLSFFSVFGLGSIGAVLAGWLLAQGLAAAMFLALGAAIASSGVIAYGIGATVEKT